MAPHLVDRVEHHVATGPGLGRDVTLVEDVAVVQVPHQLLREAGQAGGEEES